MRQINPARRSRNRSGVEKEKQTAQELGADAMSGETFDSCRGPCAKGLWETGGWHNRLYNGHGARNSITGVSSSICVHLFHLRIVRPI